MQINNKRGIEMKTTKRIRQHRKKDSMFVEEFSVLKSLFLVHEDCLAKQTFIYKNENIKTRSVEGR